MCGEIIVVKFADYNAMFTSARNRCQQKHWEIVNETSSRELLSVYENFRILFAVASATVDNSVVLTNLSFGVNAV